MAVRQTITVVVPAGPPTTTAVVVAESATTTTVASGPVAGTLPRTGAPLLPLLLSVAVALIAAGRLLVAASRRVRKLSARAVPDGQQVASR